MFLKKNQGSGNSSHTELQQTRRYTEGLEFRHFDDKLVFDGRSVRQTNNAAADDWLQVWACDLKAMDGAREGQIML